jgi:hypothetical protein
MTVKDKISTDSDSDGILRPPRVVFSSFSTRVSIPCGVLGSMSFALKAGSLLVTGVTRNQQMYTFIGVFIGTQTNSVPKSS